MKRIAVLVIIVALIAGMVGCPADPEPTPPVEYSLTISSSEGGEVTTPGEGVFVYSQGERVSLVATPASGYYFGGWAGDVNTIANARAASTTITMNGDYSITANFQVIPVTRYDLTVWSTEGGSVTAPGEGTFTHDAGTVVDLVAEAEDGYQFTEWTGSVGAVDDVDAASTSVTMMGNHSITANFAKEIRNWYDLDAIREGLNGSYVLMNDLDSATAGYAELAGPTADDGRGWQPIGGLVGDPFIDDIAYPAERFAGEFDGRGFEIRHLYINRIAEEGVGLFGSLDEAGLVRNVVLVDATVTGRVRVGGLVGENLGSISGSCSQGSVIGEWFVGGLVGHNLGTISSSYCSGSVTATDRYAGGLAGLHHGTVSNSHYDLDALLINGRRMITVGALSTDDFENWLSGNRFLDISERLTQEMGYYRLDDVGAFRQLLAFGQDASLRFRLTSDLDLAAESDLYIPYLAGTFDGGGHTIHNLNIDLRSASQVGLFGYLAPNARVTHVGAENVSIAGHGYVGSLVGWNRGEVSNSYSTGSVSAGWGVGGLVGALGEGALRDCHFTGSVTGSWGVGGLAGDNFSGAVVDSYFIGSVYGSEIGGIVGHNYGDVNNSYYDFGRVSLNGRNVITVGALIGEDFERWLANDKALDVGDRLSKEGGYYLIKNVSDLKELLKVGQDSSHRFRLMNNLDLSGEPDFYIPYLGGEFDGNGHTITNLSVTVGFISQVGLFGYVGRGGRVKAVNVQNVTLSGCRNLGGVVGGNAGTVTESYSAGSVSGEWHIGGLVGYNDWGGTVSKSCSSSSVTGNAWIGGLIGPNRGTVTNCCSVGTVTGQWYYVGGLVGENDGAVSRSYSASRVIGLHYAGGLVGRGSAWATVSNSFWDREASGQEESAGGVGRTTTEMRNIEIYSAAGWDIVSVIPGETDPAHIWNIADGKAYPFLSWQPVS